MKTTTEIHDLIQNIDVDTTTASLANILEHLNERLSQMESELTKLRKEMNE